MLFPGFKHRLRPREFVYHPVAYDPEKDKSLHDRINFRGKNQFGRVRESRARRKNPMLFIMIFIVIALIAWYADRYSDDSVNLDDTSIGTEDAWADTTF